MYPEDLAAILNSVKNLPGGERPFSEYRMISTFCKTQFLITGFLS